MTKKTKVKAKAKTKKSKVSLKKLVSAKETISVPVTYLHDPNIKNETIKLSTPKASEIVKLRRKLAQWREDARENPKGNPTEFILELAAALCLKACMDEAGNPPNEDPNEKLTEDEALQAVSLLGGWTSDVVSASLRLCGMHEFVIASKEINKQIEKEFKRYSEESDRLPFSSQGKAGNP